MAARTYKYRKERRGWSRFLAGFTQNHEKISDPRPPIFAAFFSLEGPSSHSLSTPDMVYQQPIPLNTYGRYSILLRYRLRQRWALVFFFFLMWVLQKIAAFLPGKSRRRPLFPALGCKRGFLFPQHEARCWSCLFVKLSCVGK